ncbi:RNHCP domain-containing protein [Candidatus Shapirobacteria bacterium]|nr:RNHCP domain-containing protein [Candidatus Shapirobacteria bacterium]
MRNFIRKKEDFECGNCGFMVKGNGYTDHCPKCLWGKHVDGEIPGDRASNCLGLMKPVSAEFRISNLKFKIKYKCTKCRHIFNVRQGKDDNRELLMELMQG